MKKSYKIEEEPVVISKLTTDLILKTSNPSDNMGLYWFLYQTAKWKNKFTYRATTTYIRTGLNWSKERVTNAKKELLKLELIEMIHVRNKGVFVELHTKVNVIGTDETVLKYGKNTIHHKLLLSTLTEVPSNINSTNSIKEEEVNTTYLRRSRRKIEIVSNESSLLLKEIEKLKYEKELLADQNKMLRLEYNKITKKDAVQLELKASELIPKKELIQKDDFESFWQLYPKKAGKGTALTAFLKLCNQKSKDSLRPELKVVIQSLKAQIKSDLWSKESQYIPNASTWLNQYRWLNDPIEMKVFNNTQKSKNSFGFIGKTKVEGIDRIDKIM